MDLEKMRYPIGKFQIPNITTKKNRENWIEILENFPQKLNALVTHLTDEQLNTPYRPEGWTVRQVIHHLGDSHVNSYIRFKWALCENNPMIKAYNENDWSKLPEMKTDIQLPLDFLEILHKKLVFTLRLISDEDWNRTFIHPETNLTIRLDQNLANYAWHSEHHYMHIYNLLEKENWLP